MDFMKEYRNKLKEETDQFVFLCGQKDLQILLSENITNQLNDYVRLACISLIFGYKKLFLKFVTLSENNFDDFMKELDKAGKNFSTINEWLNCFINNIANPEAKQLATELWQETTKTIKPDKFNIRQLL